LNGPARNCRLTMRLPKDASWALRSPTAPGAVQLSLGFRRVGIGPVECRATFCRPFAVLGDRCQFSLRLLALGVGRSGANRMLLQGRQAKHSPVYAIYLPIQSHQPRMRSLGN